MTSSDKVPESSPWYRGPAFSLLLALIALYIALPLVHEFGGTSAGPASRVVPGLLVCGVLVLGVRAVTRKRRAVILAAGMALVGLTLGAWSTAIDSPTGRPSGVGLASIAVFTLFLAYSTLGVFRAVLRDERVTTDKIFAAICAYLLLGFTFAFLYTFLWGVTSDELFRFTQSPDTSSATSRAGELVYFSFTTLTTLGYGDISPSSPLTRSLATFEALTGQFYVGILIARLVSLQLSHAKNSA